MTAMTSLLRARRRALALLAVAAATLAAGCGGGGGSGASVSSMSASSVRFNATMTVSVSGAGLADESISMEVDGPCGTITRLTGALDYQTQFTCKVTGVGEIRPRIILPSGEVGASLRVDVPMPQVTIAAKQGTTTGTMVLELDPVSAPVTVKNFLDYVSAGTYRNTIFHRAIKDSLIQGGGYTTGPTAVTGLRSAIVLESNNGLKNLRGTIAMARTAVFDSATSQFYFNLVDNPAFDYVSAEQPGYAVFGKLVSGLDVIDAIGTVEVENRSTAFANLPTVDVLITSISQTR